MSAIHDDIRELAAERDAVILAHNYQRAEIQDVADFVGDSLGLSREAAATDASVIVFAGVHFMAETAKILSPDKTVLMPEVRAGCPMADMLTAEQLAAWRTDHPGAPVVTYVNSSAEVKALSDICCTSANAVEVVRSLGAETVLFGPDRNLAAWVAQQLPETEVIAWDGWCPTHDEVTAEEVRDVMGEHPSAKVIAHPECQPWVTALADEVLSTSQMIRYAAQTDVDELIVITEEGLLHALSKVAPGKRFYNLTPKMICPNMKATTIEKVRDSLAKMQTAIEVDPDIAHRALTAVERMVAVG
ncbi:MAG: quinolinate synthase NadA [Coriobacteriia bacterium]|nr:quinolinate synthase NadA [Coriobacteriia bacterium]